jgi:hypothetical protein
MRYLKLALDVLMAATFVLLLNKRVLGGLAFHEIAGTAISVAFITHLLLNWDWVVKVSANPFSKNLPAKTRIGYGLNLALLLLMGFILVSGILVSKILFPDTHHVAARVHQRPVRIARLTSVLWQNKHPNSSR